MIKICPGCKNKKEMKSNQKYCNAKCKKTYENSLRSSPKNKKEGNGQQKNKIPSLPINRPHYLNQIASEYWDKIAPTVIERGHLNILSEDAFAELCDLHSRLMDINAMINNGTVQKCEGCGREIKIPGNRSLLQVDDKWSIKDGVETMCFKESALSDLKRKYSKQFLDYCKAFYLTPLSNRGNFGLDKPEDEDPEEDFLKMGDK
jgi:phage terminase small subunit